MGFIIITLPEESYYLFDPNYNTFMFGSCIMCQDVFTEKHGAHVNNYSVANENKAKKTCNDSSHKLLI